MARTAGAVRQSEVTAMMKAAKKAGLSVHACEVKKDGTRKWIFSGEDNSLPANDLDRELAEFEIKNG